MTRQQAYQELRIYRLRLDTGWRLRTGVRVTGATATAVKTPNAPRGKLLSTYLVCTN